MSDSESPKQSETYSIQLRLRRVTHEDAYVSVLVSDKVMREEEDGSSEIDWPKMLAEAIRISQTPDVDWQVETTATEPHPLQKPRPDDRTVVDSFYLTED